MSQFEDFIQVELPRRPWVTTDPAQESIPVRRGAGPRQLEFVELTDGQVLGKVAGVVQGVEIPGLGGEIIPKGHVHLQTFNASVWNIAHNFNSEDYVIFVADDSGNQLFPDEVNLVDADNIQIIFNTQLTGKAVIIFAS